MAKEKGRQYKLFSLCRLHAAHCDFSAGSKLNLFPLSSLQGDGEDTDMADCRRRRFYICCPEADDQ